MAGYIGKSLAVGGTAVDAYSKTQTDAAYLKLSGGLMTGGVRQGISSLSADTTITTSHPNVILVTTAGTDRTMTLPAASTVGGQVYRFVKVDTGAGKLILARAGSDTMGINANLTMELWYQDNYVDIMSDGSSRWMVMSTETFTIPADSRGSTASPSGVTTRDTWTDVDYSTGNQVVPAGTSHIQLMSYLNFDGDGTSDGAYLYLRKNGSSAGRSGHTGAHYVLRENMTNGLYMVTTNYPTVECDIGRIFEWNLYTNAGSPTTTLYLYARGYRLG